MAALHDPPAAELAALADPAIAVPADPPVEPERAEGNEYIASEANPADAPSRTLSDLDTMLSPQASVETAFGPHTVDLISLPENAKFDLSGRRLWFFSPFPCAEAGGTNVFSQNLEPWENAYVFLPFTLVGPLVRYLKASQLRTYTLIASDISPRKYWWPLVTQNSTAAFKLGIKGNKHTLLFPSKSSNAAWIEKPLQWDLWVFRFVQMSCPSYRECGSRRFNAPSVATPTIRHSPFVSAVATEERLSNMKAK
ncbi:uncharacterized protein LOC116620876 [Nematostella vectensis]|uniref:uncharacterized protein LOC116620876 n=1 Tax=Nematostella vectensis TaxID=45351 RepID=UPI002076D60A|nr:uncharacterized protein LOC116620876 [Nematostella vectensis]